MQLTEIVDTETYPLTDPSFGAACNAKLDADGVLVLSEFIRPAALIAMQEESIAGQDRAYFCAQDHSVSDAPVPPAPVRGILPG